MNKVDKCGLISVISFILCIITFCYIFVSELPPTTAKRLLVVAAVFAIITAVSFLLYTIGTQIDEMKGIRKINYHKRTFTKIT